MRNIENFILNGTPLPKSSVKAVSDEELYWHMHEQGKKRFGSECKHVEVVGNKCQRCLRTVI